MTADANGQALAAQDLADELTGRGITIDVALDAIGLLLESEPTAPAIVSGWMLRMMNGSAPIPGQFGGVANAIENIDIPGT